MIRLLSPQSRKSRMMSKIFRQKEEGASLIELLVAIAISGVLIGGIATAVMQVMIVKAMSANMVTATKQVENAFHYLIKDVQMSQNITAPEELEEPEWLEFTWYWADEDAPYHWVDYEIEEDKLYRHETAFKLEDDELVLVRELRIRVAQYIDTDLLHWELSGQGTDEENLEITIAATVGGYRSATETRVIAVAPRRTPVPAY